MLGVTVLLAALIVPPMVSVRRYKSQIVRLISTSLGRPVRLSSVKVRLLPWPAFVLSDLVVAEDPAYGAEPVLYASTVTASFRLPALWRGRFEISRISVDEASLNLVRMPNGRWNLDPLFRTAAAKAGAAAAAQGRRRERLPYLEATESRINFKDGVEKLPFSLLNTDLSFWEEAPGDWHIRLRGQPARTDISLYQEDTGIVRLEASLHSAPTLRQMPLHVDLDWREAQLGQLSRLLIGSDPGWRGNLTAELHLDGTADSARVRTRLRATGVHRAEFAPAEPLDFDANCGFVYHYPTRTFEHLVCNSPLGDGHIELSGEIPGGGQPRLTLALDQIPVGAGLDLLRTVRSGVDPSLAASGTISGTMTYSRTIPEGALPRPPDERSTGRKARSARTHPPAETPLSGSFTVTGFELSGGNLSQPLHASKVVLEPAEAAPNRSAALTAAIAIPAGAAAPLTFVPRLTSHGYQLAIHGEASLTQARELAHAAGLADVPELDALTGEPVSVALTAAGPWLPQEEAAAENAPGSGGGETEGDLPGTDDGEPPPIDTVDGTVTLHKADWKADYLAKRVEISQATLHLSNGAARWDPIEFTYGPLKGTASLRLPEDCPSTPQHEPCPAHFEVQFGDLEANTLQSAILGTREPSSLFTTLIDSLHLSSAPAWPRLEGTVRADSLILGLVTLKNPTAALRILPTGAELTNLDAGLLGGSFHGSGSLAKPATDAGEPVYMLQGRFEKLSPPEVGKLMGMRWKGGTFDADGTLKVSGLTAQDLAASASGTLHFDWVHGAIAVPSDPGGGSRTAAAPEDGEAFPAALARFTRLAGDAEIGAGKLTLKDTLAEQGAHKRTVEAELTFGDPPRLTFTAPRVALAAQHRTVRPVQ